jgi:hypothetical protein
MANIDPRPDWMRSGFFRELLPLIAVLTVYGFFFGLLQLLRRML